MKAPRPHPELIEAAKLTMIALALVNALKPKITKIQVDLLTEMDIRYVDKLEGRRGPLKEVGQPILNPEHLYMASDADAANYFARLDEAYKKAGYNDLKPGYCPLLMAENDYRRARNLMAREACKALPNFSYESLEHASVAQYETFLDLVLKYVGPYVRKEGNASQIIGSFVSNERAIPKDN